MHHRTTPYSKPANGVDAEQASVGNVQLTAAALGDGQAATETDPEQDQALQAGGFAGAVAQAYAAYDYV